MNDFFYLLLFKENIITKPQLLMKVYVELAGPQW